MLFQRFRILDAVDRKLAVSFGALVIALMLTVTGVAGYLFSQLQTQEEDRLSKTLGSILSESISRISFSGKYHARLLVEETQDRIPELVYISVETPDGQIIAHSDPELNDQMASPEDIAFSQGGLKQDRAAIRDRLWKGQVVKEIVVLYRGGLESEEIGIVRLGVNIEYARQEQWATQVKLLILIAVLACVAMGVVGVLSHAFGGTVRAMATQQRAMISNIADVIAILDTNGINRYKSPNIEKLFGWRPDETIGIPIWENIHPDDRAGVRQQLAELVNHPGASEKGECRYRCKEGHYPWIEYTMANLVEDPAIGGLLINYHDITTRRLAEESLRTSEERYREIFDSTSDALLIHDEAGRILDVNERMLALYGVERNEALTFSLKDLSLNEPPYTMVEAEKHIHLAIEVGPQVFEWRGRRKSGEFFWAEVALRACEIRGRKRVIASVRDITDRKETAEALLREKRLTEAILDSAPGIIYLYNEKNQLVRWNRKHEELTGYSGAELAGMDLLDWYRGDEKSLSVVLAAVQKTLREGFGEAEVELQCKDGHRVPMYMTACPLVIDDKPHFVGIGIDITERTRARQEQDRLQMELLQAQKMESVGRLAGGVAHDFNNMLGVIIGHTELALDARDVEAVRNDLNEIMMAAQRSADLTRQLLAFARKQTICPRVLNLNDTIEGLLRILRRLIGEDIELVWKPGAHLWPVKMDSTQFHQILANLAVNARDAMRGGGTLSIETENKTCRDSAHDGHTGVEAGDYVLIVVCDTGTGMDAETLKHLFEPFYTTKEVGQGTGLGLAMVYGAIKQNQGFINVLSEPGHGTTLRIYLPRVLESPMEPVSAPVEVLEPGSETVLLVEDEEAILSLGRTILERHGYTVLTAETATDALEQAALYKGPIHLLITDVVMPGLNGKELSARLTALRPGLKVLYMSGYTADVIAQHGILNQDVEFIQKPFTVSSLIQKVRAQLAPSKLRKTLDTQG
ncbi:MAG TPA: PAS domain S-box protein [Candidatus Sumerlaeota bacterium]|nr:PAS domain S-box protein [Candidatus Sumerlaeota bacterium]